MAEPEGEERGEDTFTCLHDGLYSLLYSVVERGQSDVSCPLSLMRLLGHLSCVGEGGSEALGERIRLNSPKALPCTAPYSMGDKACEPRGGRGADRGWDEGA